MPNDNNPDAEQNGSRYNPDTSISVDKPEPNTHNEHPPKQQQKWRSVLTKSVLDDSWGKPIAEAILATVAVSVALIYWGQLQVMSHQLQEMESGSIQTNALITTAARQASELHAMAKSAKISADAAKAAADTAAYALQSEQRSWIGFSDFNLGSQPSGQKELGAIVSDTPIYANLVLENFGRTPATIDGVGLKLEVRKQPVPKDFSYPDEKPGMAIFPGQQIVTINTSAVIPDSIFLAVKDNDAHDWSKGILVFHGEIRYHDAFGAHVTKLCFLWRPSWSAGKDFNTCLEYNSAE